MEEIWKDILGFEGLYKISNTGKVLSLNYLRTGKERILRYRNNNKGYRIVGLHKGGVYSRYLIHRLVASAFIPNPHNKKEVNHIDGNPQNNRVDNLEWVTHQENIQHALRTGLSRPDLRVYPKGSDHQRSRPIIQYDTNGNFLKKWGSAAEAARFYNRRSSSILSCVCNSKGTHKSAFGYMWVKYSGEPIQQKIDPLVSERRPRVILQKDSDGDVIKEWSSYAEIQRELGYSMTSICDCCHGRCEFAHGYRWEKIFL